VPIQIFTPRAQLFKLASASLAFVAAGIWMITSGGVYATAVGVVCVIFFSIGLIFFTYRLVRPVPAVQIDGFGVTDRSSAVSLGHLRWEDIASVKIDTVEIHVHGRAIRQRMLGIYPDPRVDILSRAKPMTRFLLRLNRGMGLSSINIAESSLPFSLETAVEQMRRFRPSLVVESSVDPRAQRPRG
jgi:hypothetical protein